MSIEQADIMIIMNPESSWPEKIEKDVLVNQMSETLGATIPFAEFEFTQPIELRFNELISGAKSDIAIKVFGPDFTVLSELADQMVPIVQDIAGAVDVKREMTDGLNQRHVVYDRSKMALYGVRVAEANAAIEAAFAGHVVSEIFESDRKFDVVVRFDESLRRSPDLNALTVLSMEGEVVPFSAFATLEYHSGPSMISRENSQRRVVVGANVRGRDIESVVLEIQQELETKMDLPPGYYLNYGGDFQQLQEAKKRLGVAVPAALVAIYILLYLSFRSIRLATIVFASVPLSTIGGVAALWFRGMPFSISAGIGFIALFGVAVLNGIVMISHLNKLNQGSSERESLVASALQRMRPVVMTALVAALGFLPMALSTGAGAEVQKPLATVVIGGLISATLLTLVVLPVIYRRFAGSNKTLLAVLALVVFIPNANAQEVRSLLDARVQLAKYSTEIKRSEGKLQQVSALNASDWDLPLTLNHQRGQINGLDRGDYFTTAEVQLPSFASVPSLAALHRARIENATNEVAYVRAFTDYKLENLWIRLDEAIAILNVREREYKKADMIMERILQRVALGIVPSRDSVVFGAIEEALHHGVKEQQVVVDQLQAAIAALVGWEGVLQWTPEPAILNYSTAPQITQDESLLLAPTAASVATYKAQTRVEKSYLVPALGVGVFNQRMDGLSGFNGIQFSTSIGLNPVATAKRIKYAELDYLDAELEFEQAVREWNAITQQLSAQLDRWSKDNHHIAPAQTHDVDYWMLYEAGALDLQALWSVYASGFEQELLSIEHEHAYAQAVLNWNFYQKALK
jgi:cobalt-zinc-cadmium resistance protein CzcA